MDKRILELVGNFSAWKGDAYKLASMTAELQKQIDREMLEAAGLPEAAEAI